ncbi:MAG: FAD-binding protein [Candidatus Lokiarchaeota archaeon]|nr:FAD-binding protein [Candidatus Lokiarchaeota archaeon]
MVHYNKVNDVDIEHFESVVGKEFVSANPAIRASYLAKSVMGLESSMGDVIIRPRYTEEVRKILIWCDTRKIPVSPISAGLSGGFGCPLIKPGGVVLDLSRMNRIIKIDEDSRYAIIEPGVTAGELWAYMEKYHPSFCPPIADGAPPAATVMGDAIDRGFNLCTSSMGPQGDIFLGGEVCVPTGDIIRLGSWALNGTEPFYKWGLGPELFSLFMGSQGAMGVFTKGVVKIFPHPKFKTVKAWAMDNPYDMQNLTLELGKQEFGVAHNTVMVQGGNWPLVMTRWPKDKVPNDYEFYKKLGISKWWMNWECWAQTQEELDTVTKTIDKFAEEFKKKKICKNPDAIKEWKLHPKQIQSRLRKPNKIAIPYSYWEAGFLFITYYTPWNECADFAVEYNKILKKYDFPEVMWIASIERCRQAICMPIVCFDSSKPEDFVRVQDMNRETFELCLDRGWINYRPDPFIHAPMTYSMAGTYLKYLRKVKEMFDPNYILHPGRLMLP